MVGENILKVHLFIKGGLENYLTYQSTQIRYKNYWFLLSILMMRFFTVCISSGLLAAAKRVRLARAPLLITRSPLSDVNKLFLSKKSRKHAAAIRLLPSTKL